MFPCHSLLTVRESSGPWGTLSHATSDVDLKVIPIESSMETLAPLYRAISRPQAWTCTGLDVLHWEVSAVIISGHKARTEQKLSEAVVHDNHQYNRREPLCWLCMQRQTVP